MTAPILTGRKVFLIATGAFVVMLIPNIVLSVAAVRTFSGLVVDNSYVASQSFDRDRAAQLALGWQVALVAADGVVRLDMQDATGTTVRPASMTVTVGRPTSTRHDLVLALEETPGGYAAPANLAAGAWRVQILATAPDGTPFRQARDIVVR